MTPKVSMDFNGCVLAMPEKAVPILMSFSWTTLTTADGKHHVFGLRDGKWYTLQHVLGQAPKELDDPFKRLIKYVKIVNDKQSCWEWGGGTTSSGHPAFSYNGVSHYARKVMHLLLFGPTEKRLGMWCKNIKCVRPSHIKR